MRAADPKVVSKRETGVASSDSLRGLLQPAAGVVIPGAPNALAARIVEQSGFPCVYMTGAGVANSFLGGPDLGLTSVTEMAAHVAAMRDAVSIPIIADGDTGFGNALNMVRTVRLYERAGANAIQIEDQVFPKRCGHFENKTLVPPAEMVSKIKAAIDSRSDDRFLILARTDARGVDGFDAALERIAMYKDAGADLLFVEAPLNEAELARIPREVPGSHFVNVVHGGKTPMLSRQAFADMGYAGVLYANAALQAAMLAMQKVADHLRSTGSLHGIENQLLGFDDRQLFVNYPRWAVLERKYALD